MPTYTRMGDFGAALLNAWSLLVGVVPAMKSRPLRPRASQGTWESGPPDTYGESGWTVPSVVTPFLVLNAESMACNRPSRTRPFKISTVTTPAAITPRAQAVRAGM